VKLQFFYQENLGLLFRHFLLFWWIFKPTKKEEDQNKSCVNQWLYEQDYKFIGWHVSAEEAA